MLKTFREIVPHKLRQEIKRILLGRPKICPELYSWARANPSHAEIVKEFWNPHRKQRIIPVGLMGENPPPHFFPDHQAWANRGGSEFFQEVPWAFGGGGWGAAGVGDDFLHACARDGGDFTRYRARGRGDRVSVHICLNSECVCFARGAADFLGSSLLSVGSRDS